MSVIMLLFKKTEFGLHASKNFLNIGFRNNRTSGDGGIPLERRKDRYKEAKNSFIINCNTLLHVSTLLGHLQGELFVIVTLRLHSTDE
jgi:hypothetical protein